MAAPEELGVLDQGLLRQLLMEELVDFWLQTFPQLEHTVPYIWRQFRPVECWINLL